MKRAMMMSVLLACGGAQSTSETTAEREAVPVSTTPAELPDAPGEVSGAPNLMPIGLTSFGAAVQDGAIYVLGGYFGTPHHYLAEHQSRALLRLELTEGAAWESLPGLEAGLQSVALVAHEGALHRAGGMRVVEPGQLASVDEHQRFVDGTWEQLPPMPAPRSSHDAIALGDALYVVGGWRLEGNPREGSFYDDFLRYTAEGGWESQPSPVQRRALALAATESHLVAIGGLTPEGEVSAKVDAFDPRSGEWMEGPAFPGDRNAFGVAAVGVGERFYASGRDGILWSWAVGESEWSRAGELVFPRFFHRLLPASDGGLLAVGGIGGMHTMGRTRHVEHVALGDAADPSVVLWTLPNPGPAKNRQGVFLHGDELVLFGGNNSLGQHDFEPENFLADAHAIHVPSLRVREIAPYPARRQTMQTLLLGEGEEARGISVGGFGHDGEVARTHPEAFTYDFEENTWTERPGMPIARSQFGLVSHGDALWVFGGLDYDPTRPEGEQFRHLTEVLRAPADGSAPFTETEVELPGPRRAFGGAAMDGSYYLVGGMREGFQLVEGCKRFDFETEEWSDIACPAHVRLNPQLVPVGSRLVLAGGTTKVGDDLVEDRSIEVYDPETNEWETLSVELPFTPKHMRAFALRDRLLIYSAHDEGDVVHIGLITLG